MHFVCFVKQVPDTAEVKIDPETNTLVRAGVESISNPYDTVAVEAAVRLKERFGGKVTAVSMGPPQAEQSLRECLSLGADEAILVSDRAFAGSDTLATSYTLSKVLERIGEVHPVDVVLCGKQAIDGDTAQVPPGIATRLGLTQLTYILEVLDLTPETITVRRMVENGTEIIRGKLPALLTAELELAKPRRAPLPRLMWAMQTRVETWNAERLGADPQKLGLKGSPKWVRKIGSPPVRQGGPSFVAGADPAAAVAQALDTLMADPVYAAKLLKRWEV